MLKITHRPEEFKNAEKDVTCGLCDRTEEHKRVAELQVGSTVIPLCYHCLGQFAEQTKETNFRVMADRLVFYLPKN